MGPLRLEGKSWREAKTLITTGIHLISPRSLRVEEQLTGPVMRSERALLKKGADVASDR